MTNKNISDIKSKPMLIGQPSPGGTTDNNPYLVLFSPIISGVRFMIDSSKNYITLPEPPEGAFHGQLANSGYNLALKEQKAITERLRASKERFKIVDTESDS